MPTTLSDEFDTIKKWCEQISRFNGRLQLRCRCWRQKTRA